tara:strand:+ start:4519 stop:4968 length:450 start_codon:yes stop_codon:yes gene_type:complete
MKIKIKVKKLINAKDLSLPKYATIGSAGMDISAALEKSIILKPGEHKVIPTGLQIALPKSYEAQIRPRSGLAVKHAVTVLNTPGTIDSDYRGEIGVILINHGKNNFTVSHGMRIAQMVIKNVVQASLEEIDNLNLTKRGSGGFGSTGTK